MAEVLIQPGFFLFERGGADQWTSKTSVYVRASRGLFFFLVFQPFSLPVFSDSVLSWWSFCQWQASGLYAATVISSSAHTKWPPTANTMKWQSTWRHFSLLGSMHTHIQKKKKKSLYSNYILITHCILSHSCIALHGNIYFNRITIQRRLNLTVVNILFTTFISNNMLESI